jgi:hypothetical protein
VTHIGRVLSLLATAWLFSGCQTVTQRGAEPAAIKSIRTVAVVQRSEPLSYSLEPGATMAVAAGIFGPVGTVAGLGFEVFRQTQATYELNAALSPLQPAPQREFREQFRSLVSQRGITASDVPAQNATSDSSVDTRALQTDADAVLDMQVSGGWWAGANNDIVPKFVVVATLTRAKTSDILFREHYCYGRCAYHNKIDYVPLDTDPTVDAFKSTEDLTRDGKRAAASIHRIAKTTAQRVVADVWGSR